MAPLVNVVKIHQLKNGFVKMEQLDETTGLRFYLHSNKLADKPILLFPGGMVKLVQALPKANEIYDKQALIRAKVAESDEAPAVVDDEVIYSVVHFSEKIELGRGGGGHLETLSRQRFTRPLPRRPRGSTSICPVGSPKGIKKKSVHNEFYYFIFCVIMLHFFIK